MKILNGMALTASPVSTSDTDGRTRIRTMMAGRRDVIEMLILQLAADLLFGLKYLSRWLQ